MKNLIIILLLFVTTSIYSQTTVKLKTTIQTEQSLTKTATKTTCTYNGKIVYKSSKGSFFIVMKSKKTGNFYKVYTTSC